MGIVLSVVVAARATETQKDLETRLGNARAEIEFGMREGNFDKVRPCTLTRRLLVLSTPILL